MIASAIQKGSFVYVYGERGQTLFTRQGTLVGFTSNTVTVKRGNVNYVYDEKGATKFTRSN